MSRVRLVLGLVLLAGLAALAVGGLGVSSASAATALPPDIKVCKKLPVGLLRGLWESNECEGSYVASGKYAWAWPDPESNGEDTIYCVLKSSGKFADDLCENETGGQFSELLVVEKFPLLLGLLLLSALKGELSGIKTDIHCEHGSAHGQPVSATTTQNTLITYTGCTAEEPTPPECKVSNPGNTTLGELTTKLLNATTLTLTLVHFTPAVPSTFIEIEFHGAKCGNSSGVLNGVKSAVTGSQNCEWEAPSRDPLIIHLLACKASGSNLKFGGNKATYEGVVHLHFEGEPFWKIQ